MAKLKMLLARVLVDFAFLGLSLKPNQIVEADEKTIKDLVDSGQVDDSAAAVKYCTTELKAKPIKLKVDAVDDEPSDEEKEAAAKRKAELPEIIKGVDAELEKAGEAEKPALQAKLESLKAELESLG